MVLVWKRAPSSSTSSASDGTTGGISTGEHRIIAWSIRQQRIIVFTLADPVNSPSMGRYTKYDQVIIEMFVQHLRMYVMIKDIKMQ